MIRSHIGVATTLVAASCSYHAGSFHDHEGAFPGTTTTVGCVDVAVASADEDGVDGSVIAYALGNRCEHRVTIDLTAVRVVGRDSSGREVALAANDPRGELRAKTLNANWSGRARIAYRGGELAMTEICVDVGAIDREASPAEHWICTAKERP